MRMGRTGWKSGYLSGQPLARGYPKTPLGQNERSLGRMGRSPAEIAEDDRDAELQTHRSCLLQQLWSVCGNILLKLVRWTTALDLTRPHGLVENATAPSAGGSPDGLGEGRLEAATFSDNL